MTTDLRVLNKYFDKIYVITLHRAVDRHEKVNSFFRDVDFEFFYGIDKMELELDELVRTKVYDPEKAKKLHRNNKGMMIGQVACSLSHRELYKEILEKGYESVLIMEDDFVPMDVSKIVMEQIVKELPSDWELVYWGYYLNEAPGFNMQVKKGWYYLLALLRFIKWKPSQVLNLYPQTYSSHLKKAGFHNTTHAYALRRPALGKLIAAQTPVALCADTLLSQLVLDGELEAYITVPKVFEQEIFTEQGSKYSYISN